MQIFKCSINGIELIDNDFEKLPKVVIQKDEVIAYSKNENEAKELYVKHTNKIIIKTMNKIIKMQQSVNKLQ